MDRREFVRAASGVGACVAVGGLALGRGAYARSQLTEKLRNEAHSALLPTAHDELQRLPIEAREAIRTWFVPHCLNAAEFVEEIRSDPFQERLAACRTEKLREQCFANAFCSHVVSESEILTRVRVIAEELGAELDGNWAAACKRISEKWGLHIREYGGTLPSDLSAHLAPHIRSSLDDATRAARPAGERAAISESLASLGKSALLLLSVIDFPTLTIPVFLLVALRSLMEFMGRRGGQVSDAKAAVSSRVALLGNRIGAEFESEVKMRIAELHGWREQAVRKAAGQQAYEAIGLI